MDNRTQKCKFQCGPNGTCLMDGGRSLCYCNEGFSGKRCDKPNNKLLKSQLFRILCKFRCKMQRMHYNIYSSMNLLSEILRGYYGKPGACIGVR
uniref:EGF-like domain-containing protein n=1 Tax=Romanomermis culicivorax TaxID=13658 RepID=A0A915K8J8_ROMCU